MFKKILLCMIVVILMPLSVFGQEEMVGDEVNNEWAISEPIDTGANCFDYYQFQSVRVSVSPEKELFQPGETITFGGQIVNDNHYPIVDGNVYVRISEISEDFVTEGHYVVEEFFALENIALEKNGTKDVHFVWTVPIMMPKGQYNVDYFFTVGKKFNLGGLPFSNEVVAGSSQFEVSSVIDGYFSFDRSAVTINGQPYVHIGNWKVVEQGSDVELEYVLKNTLGHTVQAHVTFDTYFWDSLLEEDLIKTETRAVTIRHGESANLQLVIPQVSESVYYVRARATTDGIGTTVNTRFAVEGGEHARLNYPAITKFPLKKGEAVTLFTCFHNTTDAGTKGSVDVRISDKEGKEIASASYDGDISSAMSAIKRDFTVNASHDYLTLEAMIKDSQGNVIDQYETVYSCENITDGCAQKSGNLLPQDQRMRFAVYGVLIVIFVIVILLIAKIVKKNKSVIGVFLAVVFFGSFFATAHSDAMTKTANSSKGYTHGAKKAKNDNGDIFQYNVASGTVTLHNKIAGNDSVPCDGSATYTYTPSLEFSASGGSWDTPYGAICNGLNCFGSSQEQKITDAYGRSGSIKWVSQQPSVTLSSSDNTIMSCSGMRCTAKPGKSGTVTITASFGKVTAQIYSSILRKPCHREGTPCTCGSARYDFWSSPSNDDKGVASGCIGSGYHSRMNYDGSWHNGTNQMPLNATSTSWTVTVGSCITDGACNSAAARNDYPYTATGPATPLCSAGTPPSTTVLFPAGKYGTSSNVTWACDGVGGGSSATCTAQRLAPAASCGTANGVMTNTQPAANLCGPGSLLVDPPGVTLQGASWVWSCTHSIDPGADPQTVSCSAPTPSSQCACNSAAARNDYPYTATGPATPLCSVGTPLPGTVNFVAGAYGSASSVNWTCSAPPCTGVGCASACMGSATCTASRMSPPPCDCGSVDTVSTSIPAINLCNPPLPFGPTVLENNGGWSWTCQDSSVCTGSATCTAECVSIDIDAPTNIYLKKNGNKLKVKVRVDGHQNVGNDGTCSITMNSDTQRVAVQNGGSTPEVEFDYGGAGATITAECTLEVDCGGGTLYTTKKFNDTHTVTSLCVEKTCNAQGSCQSTPKSGVASVSDCINTCNSDADCSSGRMIETRP